MQKGSERLKQKLMNTAGIDPILHNRNGAPPYPSPSHPGKSNAKSSQSLESITTFSELPPKSPESRHHARPFHIFPRQGQSFT
eukprot:759061-Hanusia_phi.AAC.4